MTHVSGPALVMAATIKDVARLADVSTATVSRVLNNDPRTAAATRERVLECIRRSGYRVNSIARSLKLSRTHTIGFVTPELANDFFMTIAKGVEQGIGAQGFNLLIASSNESVEQERQRIKLLIEKCVEGVIIIPSSRDGRHLGLLVDAGIPVVLADRLVRGFRADAVLVDNVAGSCSAVSYLAEQGHRRIGFIGGERTLTTAKERYDGYLKALAERHLPLVPEIVRFGDFHLESGYRCMKELMELSDPPTQVFVSNYFMHIGATKYLVENAARLRRIPEIASFDDMDVTSLLGFSLVTVRQPVIDIGRTAAGLLLGKLAQREAAISGGAARARGPRTKVIRLAPELVVRGRFS